MAYKVVNSVFFATTKGASEARAIPGATIEHLRGDLNQVCIPKGAIFGSRDDIERAAVAVAGMLEKGDRVVLSTFGTMGEDGHAKAISSDGTFDVFSAPCVRDGGKILTAIEWLGQAEKV